MAALAAGVATYLLNRRRKNEQVNNQIVEPGRHITQVFSRAKQHAINH